ncbi:hypothetical protein, unlikely [Trypanosoma brucei gambiense DAL972]|uniref:T. brucei spp.-specific protein n=1 Tax=Trypanosoma brucei gambiense (strain MHOM/CI/86/DAL972) TaxID=679716 RepID=C9ZJV8_TRYB9|nr:hypothetical protein, unlikely [Trypanosoma brucei gambiense DAL972]CBH09722.1 hypothetical protein, unlikely [Trypanosoma brucei gambiense DAL972]|eukprot:XP_011772015.1 hypothetical protein, unlikely [Trypanosoma brucei gambiense DAL972]
MTFCLIFFYPLLSLPSAGLFTQWQTTRVSFVACGGGEPVLNSSLRLLFLFSIIIIIIIPFKEEMKHQAQSKYLKLNRWVIGAKVLCVDQGTWRGHLSFIKIFFYVYT